MSTKTKDKYDEAVEYLTERPEEIWQHWVFGKCLFAFVSPDQSTFVNGYKCGCLTMIRGGIRNAVGPNLCPDLELTGEIRSDARIPSNPERITPADLPVFAEWQRKLDKYYGREG